MNGLSDSIVGCLFFATSSGSRIFFFFCRQVSLMVFPLSGSKFWDNKTECWEDVGNECPKGHWMDGGD